MADDLILPLKRVKIKRLHGVHGRYYYDTGQVVLDSKLTKYNIPSRAFVFHHEVFHKWIDDNGIKLSPGKEELMCEYYALFKCKGPELSLMERQFKKLLTKKYGKNPTEETILKIK